MKTLNTYYTNHTDLQLFIKQSPEIQRAENLLIQVFSGITNKDTLQELSINLLKELPNAFIIGSTTDGEILENKVSTRKIVLSITLFEKSSINIASIESCTDSFSCGKQLAQQLITPKSKLLILFASGLTVNGEEFLNGIHAINSNITVAGGLSADNAKFEKSYLICNNQIITSGAVGISIDSDILEVNNKYSLAWDNLGRKFEVQQSHQNRVYKIDNRTPYELYKHYLGEEVAKKLPGIGIEFPLIIQKHGDKIARAVIKLHDDGSMSFAGNIQEGSIVRFGIGNIDALLNGSYNLCKELSKNQYETIFIYSCMARRRFLEKQASFDIEHFSKLTNVSGFFTYGEFFSTNNSHEFLNESLTLLAMSENLEKSKSITLEENSISKTLLRQKALSNIINKTSEELDILNATLEKQVEEKTQESLQHERYIFEQDKLAQMGEMIANIAHQWRQPLSAISSSASSIVIQQKLGLNDDKNIIQTMESISKNTQFLSDTINTFRNFIKEDNQQKCVVIQDRLDLVLDIIITTFNDCNIELINNINYSKPFHKNLVIGELSQVILNIMNNAKDILAENNISNPWVKIECYEEDKNIIITVEDNGGGIDENIIQHIFEPYFTTKHQSVGTGIGLYMSRNIITNRFKGKLEVINSEHGAKFIITIPMD